MSTAPPLGPPDPPEVESRRAPAPTLELPFPKIERRPEPPEPDPPRPSVDFFSALWWGVTLAPLLGFLTFFLYRPYVCPVLFVGDSGELITAAATQGIAHPPGYPLYILLLGGWLRGPWKSPLDWQATLFGPAYGANLFSTLLAAVTVALLAWLIWRMTRHAGWTLLATLLWIITPTFFGQALIAEVYTFHTALVVLLLWCVFELLLSPKTYWLWATMLVQGFLIAHHPSSVLWLPVTGLTVVVHGLQRRYRTPTPWIIATVCLALGLSPYLSLPLRSLQDPWLDWGNPERWNSFWEVVSRATYRELKAEGPVEDPAGLLTVIQQWGVWTWAQYGIFVIPLVVGAILALLRGGRWIVLLLLAFLLATVPYWWYFRTVAAGDLPFLEVYYLPAHLLLLLLGVAGLGPGTTGPSLSLQRWQAGVVAVLVLGLFGRQWMAVTERNTRALSEIGSRFAYNTLITVPDDSVLVCEGDEIFLYWYLQAVAGIKPTVVLIENGILIDIDTWYWTDIRRRHPSFVVPKPLTTAERAERQIDTVPAWRADRVRAIVRANGGREVFLTSLRFNPANDAELGIGHSGLLYRVLHNKQFAADPRAFAEQGLEEQHLGWLLRQPTFDFYEADLKTKYVATLAAYGDRALSLGDSTAARRLYHLATQLDPSRKDLLSNLGLTFLLLEEWGEARAVFAELSKENPREPLYAFCLGVAAYYEGDLEEWKLQTTRAEALDPENTFLARQAAMLRHFDNAADIEALFSEAMPLADPEPEDEE